MNFDPHGAQQPPLRRFAGLGLVVALHLAVLYALVSGLATRVVEIVRAPIETKVIEEVKPPPPPPEAIVPPPPRLEAPPPPFIPPPEVQIAAPPAQPTITATPVAPPVASPPPIAPPVAAAPPAPPPAPPAAPVAMAIGVACPTMVAPVMPAKALDEGISGAVKARATIRGGKVVAVEILSSRPRGLFDAAVRNAMLRYACQGGADQAITAEQDFQFKLDD